MSTPKGKDLIRIAMVDDDISVRELMSNHINTLDNCKVMIQAGEGQELLDKLQINRGIDLVILDIIMDGMGGYRAAEIIRATYPGIRIIFYSICKNEIALTRMAATGGHGLVCKGGNLSKMAEAIRTVMGGTYFFPDMEEKIAIVEANFSKAKNKSSGLSSNEIEFLKLVGIEKTYKEIADNLKLNCRQVDYIREELFKRFNIKNRVGLAILAYQSGIITPELRPALTLH